MRLLFASLIFLTTGCASLVNGTHQDIAITSNTGNGLVFVDGNAVGNSPVVAHLDRKHAHVVKVEQPGYAADERTIQPETNDWVWGNVIFGGLIGLFVDGIAGGMYDLVPASVHAYLRPMPETRPSVTQTACNSSPCPAVAYPARLAP